MLRVACCLACATILALAGCHRPSAVSGPSRAYAAVTEMDLGDLSVEGDEPYHATFSLENRGWSPLHILRMDRSCGCASATLSKSELAPGESAQVSVHVAPTLGEERRESVTLVTDDPHRPRIQYTLSWRAVAALEFSPREIDFGNVLAGETVTRSVNLLKRPSGRFPDCAVAHVEVSPHTSLSATWDKAGAQERLTLQLAPGEQLGEATGQVELQLAGC